MSKVNEGIELWSHACLKRDEHRCQMCGGHATEVHHIVHRSGINRLMMDNGISLCRQCHSMDAHPTLCEPFRDRCIRFMGAERYQEVKLLTNKCASFNKESQINKLREFLDGKE